MARGPKNEVTEDSKRIINICRQLLKNSDISIDEFFDSSGLSNNYWYKRMRYEAPLNTSDVEHIASTFGLTSLDIYTRALGSDAARAYEARERLPSPSPSSVPACPRPDADDDVAAAIRDHERYGLAANTDGNRDVEAETPDW